MSRGKDNSDPVAVAAELYAEITALQNPNTPNVRAIRKKYSKRFRDNDSVFILELAWVLLDRYGERWIAYELIANHQKAYSSLDEAALEKYGQGINSWGSVDSFSRTLSGPAWRDGMVDDALLHRWAGSTDRWWRRAALVSTVALNVRSQGGKGDTERTLAICQKLAGDQDDMVIKAMSWALRELVPHDPQAVREFIKENEKVLATRVKREVNNKLSTGLKNPGRL